MIPVRYILTIDADDESASLPLAEIEPREGETIGALIRRADWPVDLSPTVVRMGELYFAREEWPVTVIPPGQQLEVVTRPAGGGGGGKGGSGKTIGAAVAMIALSVLAPWAAGAIFGAGTLMANIAAAAIVAGGGLLLSHFLKPKTAKTAPETPLYNFSLAGNNARPLQMIPVGYGRRLIAPDFASPTYSQYDGDAMTTYGLYAIGCGKYQIEEIRLGDTTIWTSGGGATGIGTGMTFEVVQPGANVTLFPINVITSSEVTGQQLENAWSNSGWAGPFVVNPAGTQADQILVDVVLPNGAYATYKDRTLPTYVTIRCEVQPVDDAGAPTGPWAVLFDTTHLFAKKQAIRMTLRGTVAPGRYQVRVGRGEEPFTERNLNSSVSGNDDVVVSALRCHIKGPRSFPDVTTLAIKATADAGLQSVNNGNIKVIAQRVLPVFNGTTWSDQPTRSIAWAAADIWRNSVYSAGLPDRGLDLATFLAYHTLWNGLEHTFDHWFTEPMSVVEAIETVLKAGRAMPDVVGDTLSIVREEERVLPEMLFTDREIVRGSVSLTYALPDQRVADGVVGQYLDETTWRLAEVSSAPDEALLAKPARIELVGVTKRAQAAGLVRFMQGESAYRRTTLEFQVEAEGRLMKRGMSLAIQTEEPQTWGEAGEVTAYDSGTRTLTLSPAPSWPTAASHWVELRARDGVYFGPLRVTQGASPNLAIINLSDLTDVQTTIGRTVTAALYRDDREELPSFVFSAGQPRAYRVLVTEGSPSGDRMTLTCVNDDSRVYDVVETGVPALPTLPPFLQTGIPTISQLRATMRQEGTNAFLIASWLPHMDARRYVAQVKYAGAADWTKIYEGDLPSLKVQVSPADLSIRVAGLNGKNVQGAWSSQSVTGIDLIISSETNWLVVDVDSFRPDALDRAVLQPIFRDDDLELNGFVDIATRAEAERARARDGFAQTQKMIADVLVTGGLDLVVDTVKNEVQASINDVDARVTSEITARVGADAALGIRIDEVEATADDAAALATSTAAAFASLDRSTAFTVDRLEASFPIEISDAELAAFEASVNSYRGERQVDRFATARSEKLAVAQATADAAIVRLAQRIEATFLTTSAAITTLTNVEARNNFAQASQIATLQADLWSTQGTLSATIQTEIDISLGPGGSIATSQQTLTAQVLRQRIFYGSASPANVPTGILQARDFWLNTGTGAVSYWNGSAWTGFSTNPQTVTAGGVTMRVWRQTTAPTSGFATGATDENWFYDTDGFTFYQRIGGQWIAPASGLVAINGVSVAQNSQAIANLEGGVYGQWAVKIETQSQIGGGTFRKVSGISLIQSGGGGTVVSEFNVAVDTFNVLPAVATGTPTYKKPVFTVGTVGGVASVGIDGDMYIDGTIAARAMQVDELSAITANVGKLTAGTLQDHPSTPKFVIDLANGSILISD